MPGQASFGDITEAEFSNLLRALSANTKGRAFLAEYRRRGQPDETADLMTALSRMDSAISQARRQLAPERIAEELRRMAMTLELASHGADADPYGDEAARRMALVKRVHDELAALATGLSGGSARP
jgi:hypothetical protein